MIKRCMNCMEEYEEEQSYCPNCEWDGIDESRDELEIGTILKGRYIVGTNRGKTLADIVYIGWDALFVRKVLVMEYFPQSCVNRGENGALKIKEGFEELFGLGMERFCQNAATLIGMDDTSGLLNVFAQFQENNTSYIIYEYPGEKTLRTLLMEQGRYSLKQAEQLLIKVSGPILTAHRKNMCHGQLSLGCCYVRSDGDIAVGRFNDAGFITGDWNGTAITPMGVKEDIFELAHIIGAALTGVELWETQSVDKSLDELSEWLPDYVISALADAMSDNPDECPDDMRRFVDEILDEVTIELPSNRVYQEENVKRTLSLWNFLRR